MNHQIPFLLLLRWMVAVSCMDHPACFSRPKYSLRYSHRILAWKDCSFCLLWKEKWVLSLLSLNDPFGLLPALRFRDLELQAKRKQMFPTFAVHTDRGRLLAEPQMALLGTVARSCFLVTASCLPICEALYLKIALCQIAPNSTSPTSIVCSSFSSCLTFYASPDPNNIKILRKENSFGRRG